MNYNWIYNLCIFLKDTIKLNNNDIIPNNIFETLCLDILLRNMLTNCIEDNDYYWLRDFSSN